MWIVDIALRRPYTFIVMALCILLATPLTLLRMPTDILPEINIPVVAMVWQYSGLSAQEMGNRITSVSERALTTLVNDIEHIESQTLPGVAVIKIFLQPNASVPAAIAQTVAIGQTQLRQMPPGITPPLVIQYSASSVPVIQLGITHPAMSENEIFDTAISFLRPQLVTIPGAAVPYPYGGRARVVAVDIDNDALLAHGLSPADVVSAVGAQNLILPSGTAKLGALERNVSVEGSTPTIAELNDLPLRTQNGATIRVGDVAFVHDGSSPQQNVVRQDGHRAVLVSLIKNGGASTLSIVSNLFKLLPQALESLPKGLEIRPLFDQSVFVKAAVTGVAREAVMAATLTALMILLFLGNWRSTLIIAVSIPLSIFCSLMALNAMGETINIMTLGGLALAVGILVDDATVTIENIERHLHMGTPLYESIRDGAGEIAVPALVSTLCICIVFVPMFMLAGVAKYLFVPLAEAVVFAMLASYVLSRTLVPTLALLMMPRTTEHHAGGGLIATLHRAFNRGFESLRGGYTALLAVLLDHRRLAGGGFLLFCLASCLLYTVLGQDFFPAVDSGKIRLHLRAPTGTRIEETARITDAVEARIRQLIPADQLETVLDNIGIPVSYINLTYSNSGVIGTLDAEVLMALRENHDPTDAVVRRLREDLPKSFPGIEFYFQPADIVSQILNFGSPAALDVQFVGNGIEANYRLANQLARQLRALPGAVDVHVLQRLDEPTLALRMDRTKVQQAGLSAFNVAQNVLVSLSGSFQTAPSFWLNPKNGVVYNVAIQTPQTRVGTLDDVMRLPVNAGNGVTPTQELGNLVEAHPTTEMAVVSHYDIRPVVDLYVSVEGRDLGSVAKDVDHLLEQLRPQLARGAQVRLRGQAQTMRSSFVGLGLGLAGAIVLVYLLIVVNFQSWLDPFIIITALPAALAGIAWMLFLTGTTLSVPALTGAIMTMGVATANSILVVAFARTRMDAGMTARTAALVAGTTRIRPVLMTAAAMIIGMIPMALGLGEGGEQNAPLGRATIGGLLFATASTLLFVPLVFAAIHEHMARRKDDDPSGGSDPDPHAPRSPDGRALTVQES
ncbi:MAG: efflux RND transporter permease subunit [Pseudomonadota bacterium]|nr:efflux RND transporter permease subunit [Pseudomonadota bacterium]